MKQLFLALLMLQGVAQPASLPIASPRIVALLEGARIAVINSVDGTTRTDRSLGDTTVWKSGHSLGISSSGSQVFRCAHVALTERDGRMIPYRDGFVATTGGRLHIYNAKGETIAKYVTGLGDDRNHVCGERVVLSPDRKTLAVASGTSIALVDAESGSVGRKLTTGAATVDMAFVRD